MTEYCARDRLATLLSEEQVLLGLIELRMDRAHRCHDSVEYFTRWDDDVDVYS